MLVQGASFVFLALFAVINAQPLKNITTCPDSPHILHDGICYTFGFVSLTWQEAKARCQSNGANLISIRDIKVGTWIKEVTGTVPFWFGLRRSGNGNFAWTEAPHKFDTDGFSDWASGEPNFSTGSCVSMFTPLVESGSMLRSVWKMTPCNEKLNFVCGKPADIA
uniref:C-type lectin domain-containing protein n=1 Tax=Plectus sambesii TaxID=2011161 RepID=A0A914VRC5_9BILA